MFAAFCRASVREAAAIAFQDTGQGLSARERSPLPVVTPARTGQAAELSDTGGTEHQGEQDPTDHGDQH
ncbi:hypothetical protein, partial [Spongiactinospora gelatinilytica]|uniref:hypothetical protein n=1 Tax=Spongiactinospora gelatinilytica TaxID=2666298 RepID=UPI001F461536